MLTQTDRHLVDLAVKNTQLALRIIIKINQAVAVQHMIYIGGKGGDPSIPLVSADAEDQHKEQRKNDSRQSGTEVEQKAEGTGNYGDGKLPQQCAAHLFVFQKLHHASTLYPIPRTV